MSVIQWTIAKLIWSGIKVLLSKVHERSEWKNINRHHYVWVSNMLSNSLLVINRTINSTRLSERYFVNFETSVNNDFVCQLTSKILILPPPPIIWFFTRTYVLIKNSCFFKLNVHERGRISITQCCLQILCIRILNTLSSN